MGPVVVGLLYLTRWVYEQVLQRQDRVEVGMLVRRRLAPSLVEHRMAVVDPKGSRPTRMLGGEKKSL